MIVLETAFGSGVNVTLIDDGDTWESVGAAGWANGGRASVRGADVAPTGDVAKLTPSPIDVIVAVNVSPGVSPVKFAVPVVLPVEDVDVDVVVLCNVMVLETAFGLGVNVTVIDVGDTGESVGAGGVASWGTVRVSGADTAPTGDVEKCVPSPIDVIVAVYVSPGVRPVKFAVPVVLPVEDVDVDVVALFNVMVLETAFGSGVNVTLIEDGDTWLSVGAGGVAS